MLQICLDNMTTHVVWANEVKVEDGKRVEHVSFGSFVKNSTSGIRK